MRILTAVLTLVVVSLCGKNLLSKRERQGRRMPEKEPLEEEVTLCCIFCSYVHIVYFIMIKYIHASPNLMHAVDVAKSALGPKLQALLEYGLLVLQNISVKNTNGGH